MRKNNSILFLFGALMIAMVSLYCCWEIVEKQEQGEDFVAATVPQLIEGDSAEVADPENAIDIDRPARTQTHPVRKLEAVLSLSGDYIERLDSLHRVNWTLLTDHELQTIERCLLSVTTDSLENPNEEYALLNDILEALLAQERYVSSSAKVLIEGLKDNTLDPLWREYLLQHYCLFIEDYKGTEYEQDARFDELKEGLIASLAEAEGGLAGTSLLNIDRLSQMGPDFEFDPSWHSRAVEIALDGSAGLGSRIPAFQVLPISAEKRPDLSVEALREVLLSQRAHKLIQFAVTSYLKRANEAGYHEYHQLDIYTRYPLQINQL